MAEDHLASQRLKGNRDSSQAVSRASKPGLYRDSRGLYLQISTFGTKSWVYRFMIDGKPRKMGLGSVEDVPLAEARKRAGAARLQKLDGMDPIEARKADRAARKLEQAKAITFKQCATEFIADKEVGWKNPKQSSGTTP